MTGKAKTPDQVRGEFKAAGISIGSWAVANGFNRSLVYNVLDGRLKGEYGKAHRIAVALGLKEGTIVSGAEAFRPVRAAQEAA